jgi:adhesin/invasin
VSISTTTVGATTPITASTGSSTSSVTITLLDQFSNPVSGQSDTIWISGNTGANVFITEPTVSNASGQSFAAFAKSTSGSTNVFAWIPSIGQFTSNFATVTVNAASPSSVTVTNGGFSARVGTGVATRPTYTVKDAFGNVVPSQSFTMTVGGGGSVSPTSGTTNASGQVTLTSWTMGGTAADAANGTMSNTAQLTAGAASGTATDFGIYTWSGDAISLLSTGSTCNVSCHAWTYANMVGQGSGCGSLPTLIVASSAATSDVYNKISSGSPTCGGSQMPAGGPFYTAAQLKVVRAWINNGAQNN